MIIEILMWLPSSFYWSTQ